MLSKIFAYDGFTVRAQSADQSHLEWLDEFLSPAFSRAAGETPDCSVTLDVDDPRHESLLRAGAHQSGRTVRAFVLDRGACDLPVWTSPGSTLALFDPEMVAFY